MADPYTTPVPGASGYESATLAAKTAYQNALTRLNQERGDTLRQYGYAGDIDPTSGVVNNVRVDAGLPYGAYQQERQQHASQYENQRNATAERGIGRAGLAARSLMGLRNQFGADDAQLGQGLSGAISGFQDQQNTATYQKDSALADAQLQAARDAIAAQQFDPANVSDVPVESGPDWGALITSLLGGSGFTDSNGDGVPDSATPSGWGTLPPGDTTPRSGASKPVAKTSSGLGGAAGMALLNPGKNQVTTPAVVKKAVAAAKPKPRPVVSSVPPDIRPKPAPKKAAPKPAPKKKK